MITKETMLGDLERWFRENGDEYFLYLWVGLMNGFLTPSECEDARYSYQHQK